MSKFTKEMVDSYANKLLFNLTEEENQMVLDEFEVIDKGIDLINDIPGISGIEPMTHAIDIECTLREDKVEETINDIAVATIKYADFIPYRTTDYIFNPEKFSDVEGKTGPYLLYSTIRMKSLLEKGKEYKQDNYIKINNDTDRDIVLELLELPNILTKSLESKSLNEVADYIYSLTNKYNKFYAENKVLLENDKDLQESWLVLTNTVYNTNLLLLDILGLKVPEKM